MMKKKYALIAALSLTCLMFTACIIEHDLPDMGGGGGDHLWGRTVENPETGEEEFEVFPGPSLPRTRGNGYRNLPVFVTIYIEDGRIIDVDFDMRSQTPANVGGVRARLMPWILRTNSFDFPVDIVSRATDTVTGLQEAARSALLASPYISDELVDF